MNLAASRSSRISKLCRLPTRFTCCARFTAAASAKSSAVRSATRFDTGFVTFEKGWDTIRDDDKGLLWEHLVLDSLRSRFAEDDIFYWQDKSRGEVDFVIRHSRDRVDVVECKINPDKLDVTPIKVFRDLYAKGENVVFSPAVKKPYKFRRGDLVFTACNTRDYPR